MPTPEMMQAWVRPEDYEYSSWWNPSWGTTGDGHMMGLAVGAEMDSLPQPVMNFSNATPSTFVEKRVYSPGAMNWGIMVTEEGKRFTNENNQHGLVLSDRMENGYRVFTPEDAFRSNAFRVLLQYGFSISEAIEMLDAKQDTAEFRESLQEQRQKLEHERILLDYRQRRIESVLDVLETDGKVDFKLVPHPRSAVRERLPRPRLHRFHGEREGARRVLRSAQHHELRAHHHARKSAGQQPFGRS